MSGYVEVFYQGQINTCKFYREQDEKMRFINEGAKKLKASKDGGYIEVRELDFKVDSKKVVVQRNEEGLIVNVFKNAKIAAAETKIYHASILSGIIKNTLVACKYYFSREFL